MTEKAPSCAQAEPGIPTISPGTRAEQAGAAATQSSFEDVWKDRNWVAIHACAVARGATEAQRPRWWGRIAASLFGAFIGAVAAYAYVPRESILVSELRQSANENWGRRALEQVAAQMQVAAELARGMAVAAARDTHHDIASLSHLVNTFSARDHVDATAAWGISELDACRPQHCVIARARIGDSPTSIDIGDPPLIGFSVAQIKETINTGGARFLIDSDMRGHTRLIIAAIGIESAVVPNMKQENASREPVSAAFVAIDFTQIERMVIEENSRARLVVAMQRELLPLPPPGQQQVMRALDGIVLAAYVPTGAMESELSATQQWALWLAAIATGIALALLAESRHARSLLALCYLSHERDALKVTAESLAQLTDRRLLLCDIDTGRVVTGGNLHVSIDDLLVRPGRQELQSNAGDMATPGTIEKSRVRTRTATDRTESGTLRIARIPLLGDSMALLEFASRSQLDTLHERLHRTLRDDFLTGLLCRRAFIEQLDALITENARPSFALVGVEVASLGMINALHGVVSGDLVLQRIAQRLLINSRDLLFAGRVEDDLFACVWAVPVPEIVADRINHISNTVRERPVSVPRAGGEVALDVDVWVAATFVGSVAWCDSSVLLSRLGEALSRSRSSAQRTHLFSFDGAKLSDRAGDAAWLDRIRQAMRDESLILFGQQVVARQGSGLVPHAEVLLRLRADDGSIIPPGAFLPIAERYELIREVDRYVISRTFRNIDALIAQFAAPDGVIAVNLSARTLSDPGLLGFLRDVLRETAVEPSKICLEVTESAAFGDLEWTCNLVAEIRRLGLRVAIDDFGVGMASFSYLQRVPADYVKIDGSFVKDITGSVLNRRIVQAVTEIGHAVNMHVIAEWVASAEIRDVLEQIGVDYLQGFHLHVPQIATFELACAPRPQRESGSKTGDIA